jgi:hypothetical protein
MKSSDNYSRSSFLFLFLFIAPQIVSFTLLSVNFVSIYWWTIFALIFFCSFHLPLFKKNNYSPFLFFSIFFIFGLLSLTINYESFSDIFKIIFPFIAFVGYTYASSNRINLHVFDFFIICLYVFFYFSFYSIITDLFYRPNFDPDIYGQSSTNTIPISLNVTLFFYYIFNRFYFSN